MNAVERFFHEAAAFMGQLSVGEFRVLLGTWMFGVLLACLVLVLKRTESRAAKKHRDGMLVDLGHALDLLRFIRDDLYDIWEWVDTVHGLVNKWDTQEVKDANPSPNEGVQSANEPTLQKRKPRKSRGFSLSEHDARLEWRRKLKMCSDCHGTVRLISCNGDMWRCSPLGSAVHAFNINEPNHCVRHERRDGLWGFVCPDTGFFHQDTLPEIVVEWLGLSNGAGSWVQSDGGSGSIYGMGREGVPFSEIEAKIRQLVDGSIGSSNVSRFLYKGGDACGS